MSALARVLAARFPREFVWGVATSAYQIEGAAHEDGRGDSIWDEFCRRPGAIKDGSNGDRACDHYHRVDEDVDLIAGLGVDAYRFSIAWPRVQPSGEGAWNEKGFRFLRPLVDGLLARGIAPYLTLYHWDLPQALQDKGGWTSRDTITPLRRVRVEVARRLGDRAASIATHNEPWVVAILGHEAGIFAPGLTEPADGHAGRASPAASHGLALRGAPLAGMQGAARHRAEPVADPPGDRFARGPGQGAPRRRADRSAGTWMRCCAAGIRTTCCLSSATDAPLVLEGDMDAIRRPLDFLGINYYTRNVSGTGAPRDPVQSGKEVTDMGWEVFPRGLSELLTRLHRDYRLPPLYIMENGAAYPDRLVDGRVADVERIRYLQSHIAAMADARDAGVDVRGYFVWSLLDNFEWADGYSKRFGLVHVDYETQRRTPKDSAIWYRGFCASTSGFTRRESAGG